MAQSSAAATVARQDYDIQSVDEVEKPVDWSFTSFVVDSEVRRLVYTAI